MIAGHESLTEDEKAEVLHEMLTSEPFKSCSCCGAAYTEAEWFALSPPKGGDRIEHLILRQCTCNNTMAIEVRR